jgi:hypothetical protein
MNKRTDLRGLGRWNEEYDMRIKKNVIDTISVSVAGLPYETGGILGSHDKIVIDEVVMDVWESSNAKPCAYSPHVYFLNQNIDLWQKSGISFMGMFHTHFVGVETLSCGDIKYIKAIMNAMPQRVGFLYFPIFVLPNEKLICYKAERVDGTVCIQRDELIVE